MFLIYVLMLVCAAGLAAFVYRYDLHEKEPWYMAILAVGMGFSAMWLAGLVEDFTLTRLAITREQFAVSVQSGSSPKCARVIRSFRYSSVPRSSMMSPPVS